MLTINTLGKSVKVIALVEKFVEGLLAISDTDVKKKRKKRAPNKDKTESKKENTSVKETKPASRRGRPKKESDDDGFD